MYAFFLSLLPFPSLSFVSSIDSCKHQLPDHLSNYKKIRETKQTIHLRLCCPCCPFATLWPLCLVYVCICIFTITSVYVQENDCKAFERRQGRKKWEAETNT
ncbi:MAG: hypothetical protein JOS17DRAFT_753039 [Linnemannia elongata]|nr:MAG: hypothetical protein JOS17DRAFT_753039 [Linnemannia elongata]